MSPTVADCPVVRPRRLVRLVLVVVALACLAVVTTACGPVAAADHAHATDDASVDTDEGVRPPNPPPVLTVASNESDHARNASDAASNGSRIVAVFPNPTAEGDSGEYVAVVVGAGNWTVSDGETTAVVSGPGRVVLAAAPEAVPSDTRGRRVAADFGLANGGERVTLRRGRPGANDTAVRRGANGTAVVDRVRYREAPAGARWLPADRTWRHVDYDPRPAAAVGPTNGTVFVLPDADGVPVETLRGADRRLLFAGYTFGSERVVAVLTAARERGVRVRVLLDADPVGGISGRQARLLDRLRDADVPVRLVGGAAARYRFHHPKYAVVDDRVLVLTENWKPAGTGGNGSRGWGLRLRDPGLAGELAAVFRHDWRGDDARPWRRVRRGRTFERAGPARGAYPRRFAPLEVTPNETVLLTAPGNAGRGVVAVLDTADRRIDVLQPTVERGRLLRATKRAAERGVRVRILVSGAWYVREDNRALVDRLTEWAGRTGASLVARVAEPGDAFGKIHAKGVVADDTVVVGSLNWNPTSVGENREVAVAVRGGGVADYFRRVFAADWRGPRRGLFDVLGGEGETGVPPLFAVAAVGLVAATALGVARRLRFAAE
ncbi:phosphatidylserine/phosphatidylglycerophosphate/cardiolipin synthase family protein [Halobaculum sp. MBLA0147]|uniref:phospholipase D-like domain-containing protein n=1 Tax=Halobaculum sp. MBLA0147 TaxID=3079934 RepID=UPI0035232139